MIIGKLLDAVLQSVEHPGISMFSLVDRLSQINSKAKINRFSRVYNSSIDRYSYIGPGCRIQNSNIGSFTSISWDCQIGLASHSLEYLSTSPIFLEMNNGTGAKWIKEDVVSKENQTVVGSDVWIGSKANILAGVTIGDGAVVGAASVVTKDVEPFSIVAGNPARFIRYRFDEDLCLALIEAKWWELSEKQLKNLLDIFQIESPTVQMVKKIIFIRDQGQK